MSLASEIGWHRIAISCAPERALIRPTLSGPSLSARDAAALLSADTAGAAAAWQVGLGRIVVLYRRSSTAYNIHEHIRYLCF
jgi:hypothetical protein